LTGSNTGSVTNLSGSWAGMGNLHDLGNATIVGVPLVPGLTTAPPLGTPSSGVSGTITVDQTATLSGMIGSGGTQTYTGAVTLADDTMVSSSGAGLITFSSTIDGAFSLAIGTTGSVVVTGPVGGGTPLTDFTVAGALPVFQPPSGTTAFPDMANIPNVAGTFTANAITTTGNVTLSADAIDGVGAVTTGTLRLNSEGAVINGLVINVTDLFVSGANGPYVFPAPSTVSSNTAHTPAGSNIGVTVSGTPFTLTGFQAQALNAASTAAATAAAAAADEAANTFGTDSVAEQIEFGFAGDVGVLPPIDHRLQGVGISVPKCFNESREGDAC
jgi:hypothetical protein